MRSGSALLVVCLAMTFARGAFASPSARLVYSRTPDAASCPDEPALRKAVAARVGYDPFFPWAKEAVVVQVELRHGAFAARVAMVDEQGVALGTRELTSAQSDCAELFGATALAISIALDAAAPAEAPPAPSSTPAAEPAAPLPPPPAPPPPVAEPLPSIMPPTGEAPANAPPVSPGPFFAGLDVLSSVGSAPSAAVGGALFLGARVRSVSAALELRVDAPASTSISGGSVTSWLYAGSVVPCAHYGVVSACAVGTLGSLQGRGDARESLSKSALFAALGGRLGAEWGLTETLGLRAHIDLLRDLAPTSLSIDDHAWTAPSVVASAGVGLVVRFP